MKRRVFVVTEPRAKLARNLDLSGLDKYGEIRYIIPQEMRPAAAPRQGMKTILKGLRDFNPKKDYITWVGGEVIGVFMVGMAVSYFNFSKINYLMYEHDWDSETGRRLDSGRYYPIEIDVDYTFIKPIERSES